MGIQDEYADMQGTALDVFGEEDGCTLEPPTGPAQEVRGIFRADHTEVDLQAEVQISDVRPTLDVRVADVTGTINAAWHATVRGTRYRVVDVALDGEGMASLSLTDET